MNCVIAKRTLIIISNKTDLTKRLLYPQECLKKACKNTVAYIHPEGSTCSIAQITMRRLRRWAVIILNVACKGRNQQVFLMSYAGILQLPLMTASVRVWRVILWVVRESQIDWQANIQPLLVCSIVSKHTHFSVSSFTTNPYYNKQQKLKSAFTTYEVEGFSVNLSLAVQVICAFLLEKQQSYHENIEVGCSISWTYKVSQKL